MYGKNKFSISTKKFLINKKLFFKKKNKNFVTYLNKRFNFSKFKLTFSLPSLWNFILLKSFFNKKNIIIYFFNKNYFFYLPIPFKFLNFYYDFFNKGFIFFNIFINNYYRTFFFFYKTIFNSFNGFFFLKLKFKGKGYYIYKNKRNTIAFKFGYSHIKRVFFYSSYVKFLSKTLILIYGINKNFIFKNSFLFFNVRPINIFTGKGIRFTRQIIYKKAGKISSYR